LRRLFLLVFVALTACNPLASSTPTPSAGEQEVAVMTAVKHYFQVFGQVRATGDASLIYSVTDPEGVDRSNTQAFVLDQQAKHHLSITTREIFTNWKFDIHGTQATVHYDYQASGYNIDPQTRQPLESEVALKPEHQVMQLREHGAAWLVFERDVLPQNA
jgi:hypothetical protein